MGSWVHGRVPLWLAPHDSLDLTTPSAAEVLIFFGRLLMAASAALSLQTWPRYHFRTEASHQPSVLILDTETLRHRHRRVLDLAQTSPKIMHTIDKIVFYAIVLLSLCPLVPCCTRS